MVTPTRNLPPEAEPWGRHTDAELRRMRFDVDSVSQNTDNNLRSINGALDRMGQQIQDLTDLVESQAVLTANLVAQQAQISATVADLSSRISRTQTIATFNTGALPADSNWHQYGGSATITINVPTGNVLIMAGCSEASMSGANLASRVSFSSVSLGIPWGTYDGRNFLNATGVGVSSPLMVVRSFNVPPGVHDFTLQMGAWNSTGTASVNFLSPFITVQVTG